MDYDDFNAEYEADAEYLRELEVRDAELSCASGRCPVCKGQGEHHICCSGSERCEGHPRPGREDVVGA
jgi:hypothetical protein